MAVRESGDVQFQQFENLKSGERAALEKGRKHTILVASPFVGVITTPMGVFRVGSPAGHASRCALYLRRTRPGIAKAADFPSPVAVQQTIFRPLRTAETSWSCTGCRPSVHVGIMFSAMVRTVSRPRGSCQWAPVTIFVGSIHPRSKLNQAAKIIMFESR